MQRLAINRTEKGRGMRMPARFFWGGSMVTMRRNDTLLYASGVNTEARKRMIAVVHEVRSAGLPLYVVEVIRTPARQLKLFLTGASPLKFPVYHGRGRALDVAWCVRGRVTYAVPEWYWGTYGEACKRHGLEWGGNWLGRYRDFPHCQYRG